MGTEGRAELPPEVGDHRQADQQDERGDADREALGVGGPGPKEQPGPAEQAPDAEADAAGEQGVAEHRPEAAARREQCAQRRCARDQHLLVHADPAHLQEGSEGGPQQPGAQAEEQQQADRQGQQREVDAVELALDPAGELARVGDAPRAAAAAAAAAAAPAAGRDRAAAGAAREDAHDEARDQQREGRRLQGADRHRDALAKVKRTPEFHRTPARGRPQRGASAAHRLGRASSGTSVW